MPTDGRRRWSEDTRGDRYLLRLYVAGNSPRSRRAIRNLLRICRDHLPERADVEVVDLHQQAQRAREAQILGAPTLVKELPPPRQRIVGDLSDERRVLDAFMVTR